MEGQMGLGDARGTVAYSNAQRQKRWRDKRNALAGVLNGTPRQIAAGIVRHLGPDRARKVMRALGKRLRMSK
jgi:hypothetical protein